MMRLEAAFLEHLRSEVSDQAASIPRDVDDFIAWFEGLDTRRKRALKDYLQERWPTNRAEEGLSFMAENRDLFTRISSPYSIPAKCLAAASAKSALATAEIIGRLDREQAFPYFSGILDLAPGFDFNAVLKTDQLKNSHPGFTGLILTSWSQQNREAAFDWVLENQGPGSLLHFAVPRYGETPDHASWVGSKLDAITPAQRGEFLDQMQHEGEVQNLNLAPLLTGSKNPEVRSEIRDRLVQGIFTNRMNEAIFALEDLPTPGERIQALESLVPSSVTQRIKAPLPKNDEEMLRKKLRDWNATDAQTQAIINRSKQQP
ncbi:MAG: hypothetical protein EOP84_30050 [Verrucomicrobiaceae bacterium]|nr:MAG: hypothetical protein EOP84_30050 [Verrucomicrobiaceae bacterium]